MKNINLNNIQTYILHCKKLQGRKKYQQMQMAKFGINNYKFYENYDADELDDNIVKEYYDASSEKQLERLKLWLPEIHYPRMLNLAEISLTIKFYHVYEEIANGNDEVVLVFEDDVILDEQFDVKFNKYYETTPRDYDAVFIGTGCKGNLKPENYNSKQIVYPKKTPASKCLDSFLITKKACQDIVKTYKPFSCVSDWEIAYQFNLHDHKIYWWEPGIVKQGSEYGLFQSTLR